MFFRNLTAFRIPQLDLRGLTDNELLEEAALKPVGPMEMVSRGLISPLGSSHESYFVELAGCIWLTIGGEEKILPASAVKRVLEKELREIEEKEGRKLGGRSRKRLKDDIVDNLLPRALVKSSRTDLYVDTVRGLVFVDTSSRKAAENAVSELRGVLGSFPCYPMDSEVAPRSVLTGWVAGEPLPEGLSLADGAELRDPITDGAVAKLQRQELLSDEVTKHLESGKQAVRVSLCLDDHLSFDFGDDLVVRKLKFLDAALEPLSDSDPESVVDEMSVRFSLMSGEIGRLFDVLASSFRFRDAS